jgi:hypothetical protein
MAGAQSGLFYILAEKDSSGHYTGYYKVGTTKDLADIKSDLQMSNPNMEYEVKANLKIHVSDMDAAERTADDAVRRKYRPDGVRGKGWYNIISKNRDDFVTMMGFAVEHNHVHKFQGDVQKPDEY